MMDYMINNLQVRCRNQRATQSNCIQSLINDRTSCSSKRQGSVERLHRTLLGQIRVVKAQAAQKCQQSTVCYVRHAAWTVNRCVVHSAATQASNAAGEDTTNAQIAIQRNTTLPSDLRTQMHLVRKSFRDRRELRRNRTRRIQGKGRTSTTTRLQARPTSFKLQSKRDEPRKKQNNKQMFQTASRNQR